MSRVPSFFTASYRGMMRVLITARASLRHEESYVNSWFEAAFAKGLQAPSRPESRTNITKISLFIVLKRKTLQASLAISAVSGTIRGSTGAGQAL
jgi:hypothetical protein